MFSFRHAATRLISSRSIAITARPRTISSFTSVNTRQSKIVAPSLYQRRWASGEAEAKKEEVPISQLQPTPQEEVENAVHENQDPPAFAETANATEATEEATSTLAASKSVQQAVDAPSIADAAYELTQGISEDRAPRRRFNERSDQGGERGERSERPERRERSDRIEKEPATPIPTIYIGNLFFDVTESDLTKEFAKFGSITKVRLIRDTRGLSKGFGYATFESTEQAQKAVDEMHQQLYEGRRLVVSFAYSESGETSTPRNRDSKPVNPPSKTLFIGNMSFEMTDRDLNSLFKGIRNVIDVRVAIDRRTGQPRGFAHADFIDVKSAQDAMAVLSGKENYGRPLRIDYSYGPSAAPRNIPR